jgi:phosphoglucomutase
MIQFGTSGWRSLMAEEFTFDNVRRVVQAIATHLKTARRGEGETGRQSELAPSLSPSVPLSPVIVGYDTRFLSPEFAQFTAGILKKNGLRVLFSKTFVPTPVVSFQITHQKALGGVNFTASHNPAEYNGIKFNMANGAPASPEVTHEIERLANASLTPTLSRPAGGEGDNFRASSPLAGEGGGEGSVKSFDPRPAYLAQLKKMIDVGVIKKARMKIAVDVLYGTGAGYLDDFFHATGCRATVLHRHRDVLFGGQSPEPAESQLKELVQTMKKEKLVAGFATDGDADRFGVVDSDGTLLSPNDILPVVLDHLVTTRKAKGLVVRSVMTSHFIDAVARSYGLELKETPVGFKYIAEAMLAGGFLMGGEESGGMTISGHVPEKDGILACLLMAEIRATRKKSYREILNELRKRVGSYLSKRVNLHLTPEVMQNVRRHFETFTPNQIEGLKVKKIVRLDGFKFIFEDDSWLGIRLSGTEPVVRLYLEANTQKKLRALEKIGEKLIRGI